MKTTKALRYCRYSLLFYVAFSYFANIPGYLSMASYASYISFVPAGLYGNHFNELALISTAFFALESPRVILTSRVLAWCLGYVTLMTLAYAFAGGDGQVLLERLVSLGYLTVFVLLCTGDERVQSVARWAMLLGVLLAVGNNLYEFYHPFYFTPRDAFYANPGRAAGFYMNANRAGAALLVGMVLTVTMMPRNVRVLYALIVGLGVLLTFSRMAIIGWIIIVVLLLIQKLLPPWKFALGAVCVVACVLATVSIASYDALGTDGRSNVEGRLDWLASLGQAGDDASVEERKDVAALAAQMIAEKPVFGHGVGSTTNWSERSGAHNMYLTYMAEYGVPLGTAILPLLVLASTWGARREARQVAICFGATILFVAFFSHNVLDEYHYLLGFALMGSMASCSAHFQVKSRRYSRVAPEAKVRVSVTSRASISPT